VSLNWREIDRILEEIPLEGALVQEIRQPKPPQLILQLFNRGESFRLMFSFAHPHNRLHLLSRKVPGGTTPQRFVSFLRAHVRGGRIVTARQLGRERIVHLRVQRGERLIDLWARLWGGAGNLIVTDPEGTILDALYRRPRRGELSGGSYRPEEELEPGDSQALERRRLREFPGSGSYNERVERHYFELEENEERDRLRETLLRRLERKENRVLASLRQLEGRRDGHEALEDLKHYGNLILSNLHNVQKGQRWLEVEDYRNAGRMLSIELDPHTSPAENAESYFRRYRKTKASLRNLDQERRSLETQLEELHRRQQEAAALQDLHRLREEAGRVRARRQEAPGEKDRAPGLQFRSGAFTLLVGRTAEENDALLRRWVRGNDLWLHARDYPGAHVFVRALPGKSVPLETLLDAANLAILYSKARSSGRGDVYYTPVKHLRRARGRKTGTVLPTQEKNLPVTLDPSRVRRLRAELDEP